MEYFLIFKVQEKNDVNVEVIVKEPTSLKFGFKSGLGLNWVNECLLF